jgi:hypothetical protein
MRRSKKPYSAFFLGLAGLSSRTSIKTNAAIFNAEHSASCVTVEAKHNQIIIITCVGFS